MAKLPQLVLLALSISLVPIVAEAGKDRGGGGGGGGRLGQVSSGLGQATGGGGNSSGGGGGGGGIPVWQDDGWRHDHVEPAEPGVVVGFGDAAQPATPPRPSTVSVDFYGGVQKVHESDVALSAELAFNERRFRLGASLTRYFEQQDGRDALTLTIPTLYVGLRIDDGGRTRTHLELGAVGARTRNDPVMNSSIGGVLGGVRVEHRVSRRTAFVGDAQVMVFEDEVRAGALRAGIRHRHVQATLRYFDLNVGPALFGPEVGIAF